MTPSVNPDIIDYVERHILPLYDHFDKGHSVEHVRAVIQDTLELALQLNLDVDMAYVIAAYHDTGMCEGRETHHLGSGKIVAADHNLRRWFTEEQILTIKEAVEDHRASGKTEPRSIYGKIVADGDRELDCDVTLRRCLQFGLKNYPELDKEAQFERFKEHLQTKYGENGYMKLWFPELGKAPKLRALRALIANEEELRRQFEELSDHSDL